MIVPFVVLLFLSRNLGKNLLEQILMGVEHPVVIRRTDTRRTFRVLKWSQRPLWTLTDWCPVSFFFLVFLEECHAGHINSDLHCMNMPAYNDALAPVTRKASAFPFFSPGIDSLGMTFWEFPLMELHFVQPLRLVNGDRLCVSGIVSFAQGKSWIPSVLSCLNAAPHSASSVFIIYELGGKKTL